MMGILQPLMESEVIFDIIANVIVHVSAKYNA